jgi:uncharacterized protein (DUF2252 family)
METTTEPSAPAVGSSRQREPSGSQQKSAKASAKDHPPAPPLERVAQEPRTFGGPPTAPGRKPPRSLDERLAAGKALRDATPRLAHARWRAPEGRKDPIAVLRAGDVGRVPELVPIRYGRMLASPFAFYRGSAGVMAADLATTPVSGLRVQACGDCHLMNFGGFATPERNVLFDINDFDETLPGPWEWDLKRLTASFVLAARSLSLSDDKARETAVECAHSYRKHVQDYAHMHPLDVWYARITEADVLAAMPARDRARLSARLEKALKQAGADADFPKLTDMVGGKLSIRDAPPLIFHPETTREPDFGSRVERLLAAYRETLPEDRRSLLDAYHPVDAAMKVVGVGSVGTRCWIALLMSASNEPLFLQAKQAVASVLEPFAGPSVYPHHGQRVVMGQRLMQPASDMFLGWVTAEDGSHYYLRQLRDVKIKPLVEVFDYGMLMIYAKMCGWVLARAHSKAGDAAEIAGYIGSSDQLDEALGDFSIAYANQAERDHAMLKAAVRKGDIAAYQET